SHLELTTQSLGDRENDPDTSFRREVGIYDHTTGNRSFFHRNIALAHLGMRSLAYLIYVVRDRILFSSNGVAVSMPIRMRTERVLLTAQWLVILGVAAAFGWLHLLLLLWFVPIDRKSVV